MKILFLCSANVGRSQIAEGFCKSRWLLDDFMSAALYENKIEKYGGYPDDSIIASMNRINIDISKQKIKLLNRNMCESADTIICFTKINNSQNSMFSIENENPVDFLITNYGDKIQEFLIDDPYALSKNDIDIVRDNIISFLKGNKLTKFLSSQS